MATISLVEGDITAQDVDVVVNAANSKLLGGGGVDGAIHRKGGKEILAECKKIRAERYPDGLPTGQAVATTAGELPARWVVHTVGPVYAKSEDRSGLLADCHRNSLRIAAELGARTVSFPAISTGVYGWPVESASEIALRTASEVLDRDSGSVHTVRFVLFGSDTLNTFVNAAKRLRLAHWEY